MNAALYLDLVCLDVCSRNPTQKTFQKSHVDNQTHTTRRIITIQTDV